MRNLVLASSVLLVLAPPAAACGQRVHVEMARRAVDEFLAGSGEMLPGIDRLFDSDEVRVAFYCGSMFPDWGYEGIDPDAAEHTHWRAFQEAYFDLVKRRLGADWTREDRLRIAFFLGVVSHGVTDNPWHFSSRDRRSFLAEGKARDGASHAQCEMVGDLLLHADRERRIRLDRDDLYWPCADVLAAIRASGADTSLERLRTGCLRIETTWRAAALAAPATAGFFRGRYPWLAEHLGDYPFGGIDHGAAATAHWARYYYARFRGWYLFQDTPEYGRARDDHVYTYGGCNDGDGPVLSLGGLSRIEIAFDVSAVPPGTRIAGAKLWLHTQGGPGAPTEASVRMAGSAAALSTATVSGRAGWVAWDVGDAVRAWVADPAARRGLVLSAPGAPGTYRFDSSSAFDDGDGGVRVASRPILIVVPE